MIDFACQACKKKLRVKDESAGKRVKCPGCGQAVAIPELVQSRTPDPRQPLTASPSMVTVPPLSEAPTNPPRQRDDPTIDSRSKTAGDDTGEYNPASFLAPPEAPDEIGRLGGYRVLKVLGQGGMGMVFQAEDVLLKRKIALKTMLPAIAANKNAKDRFLREAQTAANIEHEHIITIFQVSEDRGVPFLAMPLLKGRPLDEYLKELKSAVPVNEAVRIAREIAEGLHAAHEQGMIHRDVKPGNIWLEGERKKVKILDFGLARATSDTAHLTQSGAIVGTPAFMAPEQARGMKVDARADLFSLGCILYEMLTGKRAFTGNDTMSILTSLALDTPPSPTEVDRRVPTTVSDVTMRLLEKKPEDRYTAAAEAAEALREIETESLANAVTTKPIAKSTAVSAKAPQASVNSLGPAEGSAPPPRRRGMWLGIALGLAAIVPLAWFAAQFLLRVETEHGTLIVQVDDPNVEVLVKQVGVTVVDKTTKREFQLKPGPGVVEIFDKDGVRALMTKDFTLNRDGQTTVTVRMADLVPATKKVTGDGKKDVVGLKFNGPDSYVLTPRLNLPLKKPWTIEGWFTVNSIPAKSSSQLMMGRHAGIVASDYALLGPRYTLFFNRAPGDDAGSHPSVKPVPLGVRTHLAMVHDGDAVEFFVNGVSQGKPQRAKFDNVPCPIAVGPSQSTIVDGRGSLTGVIHGVHVSATARYLKPFTPSETFNADQKTIALYRCDSDTGNFLEDDSGNGNNGTIFGASWLRRDGTESSPSPTVPPVVPPPPSNRIPKQTISLTGSFTQADRITIPGLTGANDWRVSKSETLTFTTDGRPGKVMIPVALDEVRHYLISTTVQRTGPGAGPFTFDVLSPGGRQNGIDVFIGGRIEMLAEDGKTRMNFGAWPKDVTGPARVVLEIHRPAREVLVWVNNQLAARWKGDISALGRPAEYHPEFPGKCMPTIFCFKDSFEFADLTLQVFDGEAKPLRNSSPSVAKKPSSLIPKLRFEQTLYGLATGINALSFSPDGKTIVAAGGNNPAAIRLIDPVNGKDVDQFRNFSVGLRGEISPDGNFVAAVGTVTSDGRFNEWDRRDGKLVSTKNLGSDARAVAYSPDGKWLVWGDAKAGRALLHWRDRATGKEVGPPLDVGGHHTNGATFSPDGAYLAVAAHEGQLTLYKTSDRSKVFFVRGAWIPATPVFSPDGSTVLTSGTTGDNSSLGVHAVPGGKGLGVNATVPMPGPGRVGAYLHGGTIVPWYGQDGVIRFLDAKTWKELDSFRAHTDFIVGNAVSPDGRTLATLDKSGMLKVWDLSGGERPTTKPPSQALDLLGKGDLSMWLPVGPAKWIVKDGVLRNDGHAVGHLMTKKEYVDYELSLEYRLPAKRAFVN